MTSTEIFSIANTIAMPMWLLMMVLPKWKFTRFLIDYKVVPITLSLCYVIYVLFHLQGGGNLNFGSLASVTALFSQENVVMAGWVHYLAFDLLIGMWMLNENRTVGIPQLLMIPMLLATFMLGPVGFLLFITAKAIKTK
ncbi:MAG: ABA4-like family protein [Bacteroidota bacterium]